jgi:hypothetical protein
MLACTLAMQPCSAALPGSKFNNRQSRIEQMFYLSINKLQLS